MNLLVRCSVCSKEFKRSQRRVNESTKHKWKIYCSPRCQSKAKNKQLFFQCGNPQCHKTIKRSLKMIPTSGICYCSKSCAATINNLKFHKRCLKTRICPTCGIEFAKNQKYCSLKCKQQSMQISKEQVIKEIKSFYRSNLRIPTKNEFFHCKAARSRFGSWNKAILSAGFTPNPVMFARKHKALDGHKCDSFAEMIIDNWLYNKNISHQIHTLYRKSQMRSDFLVNDIRIEFIGLRGESKKYDQLLKRKRSLIKNQKLKVIEIYPKDLFPKNNLNKLLKFPCNQKV